MNIKVKGGQILSGEITPSGSKNSAVALVAASILFDKPVIFNNIPEIPDVERLVKILQKMGSMINWNREKQSLQIDNANLKFERLDREDLGNMKGTALLWGPMLARFGKVNFTELPGGCTLGERPLGPQYYSFRELGVKVKETNHSVEMYLEDKVQKQVWLPEMSPTVTENIIMIATNLKGKTKIIGAASEPQVQDLCEFLIKCGVKISGIGSTVLEIEGNSNLTPKEHSVWNDHYEIATFLAIAAATGGEIKIKNAMPELFNHINYIFSKFGVEIRYEGTTAILKKGQKITINPDEIDKTLIVRAQPWPSLPVDLLPIFIPLALGAQRGETLFHNWMYEAGLFWTSELTKLGANVIMCDPHRIIVGAGRKLIGDKMEAPYIIRAVIVMVIVAMMAEGESTILNADALYRGHPHFAENLRKLGAKIEEVV